MANLVPEIQEILSSRPLPTEGELHLIKKLQEELDDTYHIYFQSYLNGLHPDVIILKDGYGMMIIEVKDYNLDSYEYIHNEGKFGELEVKSSKVRERTPFEQVAGYKDSIYNLYSYELAYAKALDKRVYSFVQTAVYFHNATEEKVKEMFKFGNKNINFIKKWGRDSLVSEEIKEKFRYECKLDISTDVYKKLHTQLRPIYNTANTVKNVKLDDKQLKYVESNDNNQRKICGVAGCGKSTVLAYRAANILKRKGYGCRILVLTYNITLVNYLRDKISAVYGKIDKKHFNIINFHQFIVQAQCEDSFTMSKDEEGDFLFSKDDIENISKKVKHKYDAILIDEGQDFKKSWFDVLKQCFLKENGEYIIMADEKQNIYEHAALSVDKKIETNIGGKWSHLNNTYRFDGKLKKIAKRFQQEFYKAKYEIDEYGEQLTMNLDVQDLVYVYDEHITNESIFKRLKAYMDTRSIHPNNVCILADEIDHLRELEYHIRNFYNINCEIMFETFEEYLNIYNLYFGNPFGDATKSIINVPSISLEDTLKNLRRIKKFGFNNNSGKLKLSTTQSFKGWEADTVVLIIDKDDKNLKDELIYTALTRAKKDFILINRGVQKYDAFFKENMRCQ